MVMEHAHVHRLVVVDEEGQVRPIGVISTSDLVRVPSRAGQNRVG